MKHPNSVLLCKIAEQPKTESMCKIYTTLQVNFIKRHNYSRASRCIKGKSEETGSISWQRKQTSCVYKGISV